MLVHVYVCLCAHNNSEGDAATYWQNDETLKYTNATMGPSTAPQCPRLTKNAALFLYIQLTGDVSVLQFYFFVIYANITPATVLQT